MDGLNTLIERLDRLTSLAERLIPKPAPSIDWSTQLTAHWVSDTGNSPGHLQPVAFRADVMPADLIGVDRQLALLETNTRQFLNGLPANNALLWGARGTGKSSLIRALLNRYQHDALRLIEIDRADLTALPNIVTTLADEPWRFILFCDDLSFEPGDAGYKALKVVIDGSISAAPDNVLIYATSNRRHLVPEYHEENQQAEVVGTEIHHADVVEEKISLSERFGLWVSFHPFNQEQYLAIADHWLRQFGQDGIESDPQRADALRWALQRGSRSGRVAWQFAKDQAGKAGLD